MNQQYLLIGQVQFDSGTDSDWVTPIHEEILAKNASEAEQKASQIAHRKLAEARTKPNFDGFAVRLYGPFIKGYAFQKAKPARPNVKAVPARKEGLVEIHH